MTSDDLPGFHEAFRSLQRVFPLRGTADELDRLVADYFRSLRRFALADVKAASDGWLARGTKFPKPAEWIAAIPRRVVTDCRQMTQTEAREYHRAELLHWEDEPCKCAACVEASVDWKPLRFVPELDDNDQDIHVENPITQRIVTAGHWAHGRELFRYYDAKATFYSEFLERFGARPNLSEVGREKPRPAVVKARMKRLVGAS